VHRSLLGVKKPSHAFSLFLPFPYLSFTFQQNDMSDQQPPNDTYFELVQAAIADQRVSQVGSEVASRDKESSSESFIPFTGLCTFEKGSAEIFGRSDS